MATATLTLAQEAAQLRKLKLQAAKDAEKAKQSKLLADEAEIRLFDRMEAEEVDGIKYRGTNFVPVETVYGQVQDRSAFIAWAEANDISLVETRERKALVNELVRERLDNGESLPDGLGFYLKRYVSQRGANE